MAQHYVLWMWRASFDAVNKKTAFAIYEEIPDMSENGEQKPDFRTWWRQYRMTEADRFTCPDGEFQWMLFVPPDDLLETFAADHDTLLHKSQWQDVGRTLYLLDNLADRLAEAGFLVQAVPVLRLIELISEHILEPF